MPRSPFLRLVPGYLAAACLLGCLSGCLHPLSDATAESDPAADPAAAANPGNATAARTLPATPDPEAVKGRRLRTRETAERKRGAPVPVPIHPKGTLDPSKENTAWLETNDEGTQTLIVHAPHAGSHTIGVNQILQSVRSPESRTSPPTPRPERRALSTPDSTGAEDAFHRAAGRGEEDYLFLRQMTDAPDPAQVDRVLLIAQMPHHPFATLAWNALGSFDTPVVRSALRDGVRDPLPAIRCAALGAFLRLDPGEAARQARRMLHEDNRDVRLAALTVLGETRDRASRAAVRALADTDDPVLRIRTGWVLMEMEDPEGARVLRSFATNNDPMFAVQAMAILTHKQDEETVPLLFHNLYHSNDRIMKAALECLERFPESARNRALRRIPEEQRTMLANRRLLLLCHAGSFPVSRVVLDAARSHHPSDRLYAMRALVQHQVTREFAMMIDLAFDPNARIRDEAQAGVRAWVAALNLPEAPAEFRDIRDWQRWWFREHRILATAPGQVLLALPTGETKPFRLGSRLDFDAVIESVQLGYGEDNRQGALVMIHCAGRPYSLTP